MKLQDTKSNCPNEFQEHILPKWKLGPQHTMDNFFYIVEINISPGKICDLEIDTVGTV